MHCASASTRTGHNGCLVIVCLVNLEPVLADLVGCDRYTPQKELVF